jgi:prenyltransferase beta subunit
MLFNFCLGAGVVARLKGLKRRVAGKKGALITMFLILCSFAAILGASAKTSCADSSGELTAAEMAAGAVDFIHKEYINYKDIDGYSAYVLNLAGEDLASEKWTRDNETLKSKIMKLAGLLGDSNNLITYIINTQNADGSFGPYANESGSKVPIQALAAIRNDLPGTGLEEQVNDSLALAVNYFKNGYCSGSMPYSANGWNFDYRCVEALAAAGEDLAGSDWLNGSATLMEEVLASAQAAAAIPEELDAVRLAKEISVINAVYPDSEIIDILAGALIARVEESVPGQLHFGSSVYDHVLILTALGKAGKLGLIDQDQALAYLNTFKNDHFNSWGQLAGAAWGGYDPEEPDLTAQVLTALSYFDDADRPGSSVHSAIADGLAYLADIQDSDTAAINAPWDSTVATAETLIALKSIGRSFDEYAGASSIWVKQSKTKTIAQCLLAVSCWSSETATRDRLAGLLAGRQKVAGAGLGSFENSVYSDMWAYIALAEAGRLNSIDTAAATDYILSKQGVDGSWGEFFGDTYYADVLTTTQALRALSHLSGVSGQHVRDALEKGLDYLRSLQQADGGVYSVWDDPAIDNSELIITLYMLEEDPSGPAWKNDAGLTPVDYLLNRTMNEDGSFGTAGNVFGAAEALAAYLLVGGQGGSGGNGGGNSSTPGDCSVKILVVGMNDETLFGPGRVNVSANGQWGKTAMGALHATGLSYSADRSTGFVSSIAGQSNSGMNGWMFKVNGVVPMVPAKDKLLSEGDEVVWWYSTDMESTGPDFGGGNGSTDAGSGSVAEVLKNKLIEDLDLPPELYGSEEALEALGNLAGLLGLEQGTTEMGPLGEAAAAVVVVGTGKAADRPGFLQIKNELAGNPVDLAVEIDAAGTTLITDELGEIGLLIPEGAFSKDLTVTVKKAVAGSPEDGAENSGPPPAPAGYCQLTSVYSLGPEDAGFIKPATLAVRLAIPPPVRPDKIVLARCDRENKIWLAVPAVVDVEHAVILGRIDRFTEFAVLAGQERRGFEDVNGTDCGWAKEPVELLAGAGVVEGFEGCFEPHRPITRAELTKVLVKGLGIQEAAGAAMSFKDITGQDAFSGYIAAAVEAGLVRGYEDHTFRPERAVTREEAVTILARGLGLPEPSGEMPEFADASEISPWATDSVAAAVSAGLVRGYPDNTFRPGRTVTRAECAVLVYRALFPGE